MANPPYPDQLRARHLSGAVVISAVVTADGKIDEARVVQKIDPDLDKAALEDTRAWLFKPGQNPDGTRVPVHLPLQINFVMF